MSRAEREQSRPRGEQQLDVAPRREPDERRDDPDLDAFLLVLDERPARIARSRSQRRRPRLPPEPARRPARSGTRSRGRHKAVRRGGFPSRCARASTLHPARRRTAHGSLRHGRSTLRHPATPGSHGTTGPARRRSRWARAFAHSRSIRNRRGSACRRRRPHRRGSSSAADAARRGWPSRGSRGSRRRCG